MTRRNIAFPWCQPRWSEALRLSAMSLACVSAMLAVAPAAAETQIGVVVEAEPATTAAVGTTTTLLEYQPADAITNPASSSDLVASQTANEPPYASGPTMIELQELAPSTAGVLPTREGIYADPAADPRVAELVRPLSQIRLPEILSGKDAPPDEAGDLMAGTPPRYLLATASTPPPFVRYPAPFYHQPLYFEEVNLERCGRGCGYCQNAVSSFWFVFGTIVLPYRLATEPYCECVRSKGDCRTCEYYASPIQPLARGEHGWFECKGVTSELAVIAGFSFLLL